MFYNRMKVIALIIFSCSNLIVYGQYIAGLHTDWDDSFKEWNIVVGDSDTTFIEGDLDLTWGNDENFKSYTFRIGEDFGEIKQVFTNSPTNWELRMGSELVSIRSVWPSDPREWKVSNDSISIVISTRYPNVFDEWIVKDDRHGEYYMYTDIPGDVRDWIIEDYMDLSVPYSIRIGAAFIAVYMSSPKF